MPKPPTSPKTTSLIALVGVFLAAVGGLSALATSAGDRPFLWFLFSIVALVALGAAGLAVWTWGVQYRGWPRVLTYAEKQERREHQQAEREAEGRMVHEVNRGLSQIQDELSIQRARLANEIAARSYAQIQYYRDAYIKHQTVFGYTPEETETSVRDAYTAMDGLNLRKSERNRTAANASDFDDARWLRLRDDEMREREMVLEVIDEAIACLDAIRFAEPQEPVPATRREQLRAVLQGRGRGGRGS